MISQVNSSVVNSAYANNSNTNVSKAKESENVKSTLVTKQGDKVDLNALSELIADELL